MLLFDPPAAGRFVGVQMFFKKSGFYLFALTCGVASVFAQEAPPGLQWDETTIQIETEGGTESKNATFHFRNTSDKPVVIRSVTTSCGCTVTKPNKTEYAPGESGILPVTHKPKPGPGVRNYRINVQTDEGGGRLHTLTLQVANRPRIAISPRVITWEQGEDRKAKNINVQVKKDDPIRITGARPDKDFFDVQVISGSQPDQKTLVVTPKPDAGVAPGRVRVQILTDPPLPPSMDNQFFVVLR